MTSPISRRFAMRRLVDGSAALAAAGSLAQASVVPTIPTAEAKLKGRIHHSVCRWCFSKVPLDELCQAAKSMGITSIDLAGPSEWPTLKKYGLTCAMANGAGMGIEKGFNRVENHDKLVADFEALIPKAAAAGLTNVICMSGNRAGLSDEQGLVNCAIGLKRLMNVAEKHKVNVVMELLNSKVNHKDYQCDHTAWGVDLCRRVESERFKLLYDIYHMQIMEGDLISTIKANIKYIAHFHTGGVPGRGLIDETQEIYYPAVMKAIAGTGYTGFVAQEFTPRGPKPLEELRKAIAICDV
jgi:hydroxypyruvate isomerase